MRHRTGLYEIETQLLSGPADPELWYWHLYRGSQRINGGVAVSEEQALYDAGSNRRKDNGDWKRAYSERV